MASRSLPLPLPDPPLGTDGLRLRPWRSGDAVALAAAWADPAIQQWTGVPEHRDVEAAERWIVGESDRRTRGLALDLVIETDGEVVGEIGLFAFEPTLARAEIGWWVAAAHRGRGWARSAAQLLSTWALDELAVDLLEARCAAANPASGGVATAAGFELTDVVDGMERWQRVAAAGATLHT